MMSQIVTELHSVNGDALSNPALAIASVPETATADDPTAMAVQVALARGLRGILLNEPAARRGGAEGVHEMRKASRRLRAELRMFRPLIDGKWGDSLVDGLRWLGRALGEVRDLDVLKTRLRATADNLAADLGPLFANLDERHAKAREAMLRSLDCDRLWELMTALAATVDKPRLTAKASKPCAKVLPPLVGKTWRRLRAVGRVIKPNDPDEVLHEVRIRAKRARYAAETVGAHLQGDAAEAAARFAHCAEDIQESLGSHQDAVVARQLIMDVVHNGERSYLFAAGRMLERLDIAMHDVRDTYPTLWRKIDRRQNTRWMKP
jgi:CHAD domain-containing protein